MSKHYYKDILNYKNTDKKEELIERVDTNKLYFLVNNPKILEDKKLLIKQPLIYYSNYLFKLRSGINNITYIQKKGVGRYYSKCFSLQSFKREIRACVASDIYVEVDQVNSNPTILLSLANDLNLGSFPILTEYVKDRKEFAKKIGLSENKLKAIINTKILFVSKIKLFKLKGKEVTLLIDLHKEILVIQRGIARRYYHTFRDFKRKYHIKHSIYPIERDGDGDIIEPIDLNKNNVLGSFLSIVTQDIESKITMVVFRFFKEKYPQLRCMSIIHDGILVPHSLNLGENVLKELSDRVYSELGIRMFFKVKDLHKDVIDLSAYTPLPKYIDVDLKQDLIDLLDNDQGMAKVIWRYWAKNNLRYVDDIGKLCGYLFNKETLLWEVCNQDDVNNLLSDIIRPVIQRVLESLKQEMASLKESKNKDDQVKYTKLDGKVKELFKISFNLSNVKYNKGSTIALKRYAINRKFKDKLNNSVHELAILNGKLLDLKTLNERYRTNRDFFTEEMKCKFLGKSAPTPHALSFINDICGGDQVYVEYFLKLLGTFLTREICDKSMYIWHGDGNNGKTTTTNILYGILGEEKCVALQKGLLTKCARNEAGRPTPELIPLKWANVAIFAETTEQEELNDEMIKKLTGGDFIYARGMRKEAEQFKNKSKCIIPTNNRPLFNVQDKAMLTRVKFCPFNQSFENNPENKAKVDDLLENKLDEFFTLFSIYANKWYNSGKKLIPPPCMNKELEEYIQENDIIGNWINDRCKVDAKLTLKASVAHPSFISWCNESGVKCLNKQAFAKRLEKKHRKKKTASYNVYVGLDLDADKDDGYGCQVNLNFLHRR